MSNLKDAKNKIESILIESKKFIVEKIDEYKEDKVVTKVYEQKELMQYVDLYVSEITKPILHEQEKKYTIILENDVPTVKKLVKNHNKVLGGLYFITQEDADNFVHKYNNILITNTKK